MLNDTNSYDGACKKKLYLVGLIPGKLALVYSYFYDFQGRYTYK